MDKECTMVITGSQPMSYLSDIRNLCWFMEAELEKAIRRLHCLVENAVVDNRYIVVGTGSTQLYQAVLYALTSPGEPEPFDVVCAAPYYSVSLVNLPTPRVLCHIVYSSQVFT